MPTICETCGAALRIGDYPFCHGNPEKHQARTIPEAGVIGDEIDVVVRHGLCHDDGTPRRWRSREALRREAKKRGLTNYVAHKGLPGTDKNPHTQRFV